MLPSLLDPARHTLLAGPRADERGRSAARRRHWDRADLPLQVGFGAIWQVDAYLKWQPAFQAQFLDLLQNAANDQPAWQAGWSRTENHLPSGRRGYSLLIGATAEGFGGVTQPGTTDLGAAIVYAVVFLALLALLPRRGSADTPSTP